MTGRCKDLRSRGRNPSRRADANEGAEVRLLIGTRRVAPDVDGAPGEWSAWEHNWIAHELTEAPPAQTNPPNGRYQPHWEQVEYRWFVEER